MKRKRLALLLAAALTITSADGTALMVRGADFSSEPVQEEKPVDRSAVRAKLAELTRLGFSDEVKALLQKHGAERLSAVDDAEFPALMKEAEALGSKA